ncbi:MAG: aspartate carbamoyltransferase, partial [Ilumatobacteraceae bacterium]
RVAIVGDVKHSRVARSTSSAFRALGADVTLVAPRTLLPPVVDEPSTDDLDELIDEVDVLYLLRMQRERMREALVPSLREYTTRFGLTPERAARLPGHALVMHPGPMNRGVEIAVDPAELPGAVITRQVANGIAVRMAVLFDLLGSGAAASTLLDGDTP